MAGVDGVAVVFVLHEPDIEQRDPAVRGFKPYRPTAVADTGSSACGLARPATQGRSTSNTLQWASHAAGSEKPHHHSF